MSEKPVKILLTDPPWWYNDRKTGGERKDKTKFGGGCRKHYPVMTDPQLMALAPLINQVMANDSACLMWVTDPRQDFGIELIKKWGFRYVTAPFHWFKTVKDGSRFIYGPGFYTGSNHESVIMGVRGSMEPLEHLMESVIIAPRMAHSVKPPIHRLISRLYPTGRKVEMFARRPRKRWEAIGNGMTGRDIKDDLIDLSRQINGMAAQQTTLF